MTITTLTVGGQDHTSYASISEADIALAVDPVRGPTWRTLAWGGWIYNGVVAEHGQDVPVDATPADGDGVEYIYRLTGDDTEPSLPAGADQWPYDEPESPYTDVLGTLTATDSHAHRWSRMVNGTPTKGELPNDAKAIRLLAATRRLDLLPWKGTKTGNEATQHNAFPREGLTYRDGTEVPDNEVPISVETATILLAGTIAGDVSLADAQEIPTSGIKKVEASGVSVEFQTGVTNRPRTDPHVHQGLGDETVLALVRQWLDLDTEVVAGSAYGTDGKSSFDDEYERSEGYA